MQHPELHPGEKVLNLIHRQKYFFLDNSRLPRFPSSLHGRKQIKLPISVVTCKKKEKVQTHFFYIHVTVHRDKFPYNNKTN
jgi:hypothetical protein